MAIEAIKSNPLPPLDTTKDRAAARQTVDEQRREAEYSAKVRASDNTPNDTAEHETNTVQVNVPMGSARAKNVVDLLV